MLPRSPVGPRLYAFICLDLHSGPDSTRVGSQSQPVLRPQRFLEFFGRAHFDEICSILEPASPWELSLPVLNALSSAAFDFDAKCLAKRALLY